MTSAQHMKIEPSTGDEATLVVFGTFTLDGLVAPLEHWLGLANLSLQVSLAPYQQTFQQLLDPTSLFRRNRQGVNLLVIRYIDWLRDVSHQTSTPEKLGHVEKILGELAAALSAISSATAPLVLVEAPYGESNIPADAREGFAALVARFRSSLAGSPTIHRITVGLDDIGGEAALDQAQDTLAHIPFSDGGMARLAGLAVRRVHAITVQPRKVLVLDCDNTLWGGVVGEDGIHGITLSPGYAALQRWAVKLASEGVVVALCSKNVDEDVAAALAQRSDFPLRPEHIVAKRVNWLPKAQNLKSLAGELNLGLDSFVFLDDNPVECGQVQAALPQVLTLQVPPADQIAAWVENLWCFDRTRITAEDRDRTSMYRANAERRQLESEAASIEDFIAGLALEIDAAAPTDDEIPRLAQLTQRTNQFNASTVRRSEAEVRDLQRQPGAHLFRYTVKDRFGDYGLVGAVFARLADTTAAVDTFLLSCRVLGRGVEYAMLREFAAFAAKHGADRVAVRIVPSAKNEPMRAFLDSIANPVLDKGSDGAATYTWSVDSLRMLAYRPGAEPEAVKKAARGETQKAAGPSPTGHTQARYADIAHVAANPARFLRELRDARRRPRDLPHPAVAPATPVEEELADMWREILGLSEVGVTDDYFEAGGTSLRTVSLFAAIQRRWHKTFPLTTILNARTIRSLGQLIVDDGASESGKAILLRAGHPGAPTLFLVHDGDGEILLYRNLAHRIKPGYAIYGLPPLAASGVPLAHTTIEAMARHYIRLMEAAAPQGPYLIGGMCAGGTIAIEIGRQLEERNQAVGGIFAMDSAAPKASPVSGYVTKRRFARFTELFDFRHHRPGARMIVTIGSKIANAAAWEIGKEWKTVKGTVLFRLLRRRLATGKPWPHALPPWTVRQIYDHAAAAHDPAPLKESPVFLFRASTVDKSNVADLPFKELYSDPDFGWGRLCRGPLEVIDVVGGHASMLQEPQVRDLAARMNERLP